jgi:hypothetical protein
MSSFFAITGKDAGSVDFQATDYEYHSSPLTPLRPVFEGTAWLAGEMQRVWQIAGGELGRRYDDLFLKHDVMFCGPGRFGPFDPAIYSRAAADGQITTGEYTRVSRFAEVRPGEVVLLRSARRREGAGGD